MKNARCKCGKSAMNFPRLPMAEIDRKWTNSCCEEAPQAEPAKLEEPKEEAPKPLSKSEAKRIKIMKEVKASEPSNESNS